MKKLSTMLAVVALVGTASAFAANPFSDVTPSDWAYQAVSSLASQGIINGYPDGTFQGQRDITRFEVAQMVAKAIAHEDKANDEQRMVINKLAEEFASELNSLGVRVAALENKVGNVTFSGDARIRYESRNEHGVMINVPNDGGRVTVGGKEVTFDKAGLYEVKFPEAQVEGLQDLEPNSKSYVDHARNEVVVAAAAGMTPMQNPLPLAMMYGIYNKPNNPMMTTAFAMNNGIAPFDIPQGLTTIEAFKYAYDKVVADKQSEAVVNAYKVQYENLVAASQLNQSIYELARQYAVKADKKDAFTYRVRLNAHAKINEKTEAGARLVLASEFGDNTSSNVSFDRLWVKHNLGFAHLTAGRMGAMLGDGLVLDSTLDGAVIGTQFGNVGVMVGYGYPTELLSSPKDIDQTITFAQVAAPITKHIMAKAYAASLNSKEVTGKYFGFKHNLFGVSVSGNYGAFGWNAEYAKRTEGKDNMLALPVLRDGKGRDAYMIGASYAYGPATLQLQYFKLGQNSPILDGTYDTRYIKNWKGFVLGLDYAFTPNMNAKVAYTFKGKAVEEYNGSVAPSSQYYAQLEYRF